MSLERRLGAGERRRSRRLDDDEPIVDPYLVLPESRAKRVLRRLFGTGVRMASLPTPSEATPASDVHARSLVTSSGAVPLEKAEEAPLLKAKQAAVEEDAAAKVAVSTKAIGESKGPGAHRSRVVLVFASVLQMLAVAGIIDTASSWVPAGTRIGRADANDGHAVSDRGAGHSDPAAHTTRSDARPPGGSVPKATTERTIGSITVVDIGYEEMSLEAALAEQRARAQAAGEELLVMTVADGCEPCDGVGASLSDPLMQRALDGFRFVRVDIEVFRKDLDGLNMQRKFYPGYFLLAPDLTPRDAIDGGEWGEDIAENIAPVLGPFVRGRYTDRKRDWEMAPGSGIRL